MNLETSLRQHGPAHVTYRATLAGGSDVEIRLEADPDSATLADAWTRLTALYAEVDPRSIEIEIRHHSAAELARVPAVSKAAASSVRV